MRAWSATSCHEIKNGNKEKHTGELIKNSPRTIKTRFPLTFLLEIFKLKFKKNNLQVKNSWLQFYENCWHHFNSKRNNDSKIMQPIRVKYRSMRLKKQNQLSQAFLL